MTIFEIVMKLNGPVQPIGCSNADEVRLANLKALTDLTELIFVEIREASKYVDSHEASVNRIAIYARDYLDGLSG